MAFPCIEPCAVCPTDPGNPFLNISSEAPDVDYFINRRYPSGQPPFGHLFYAAGCLGFCASDVSQAEADLCAARQNVICTGSEWPLTQRNSGFPGTPGTPPTTTTSRQVYANREQSCTYNCPDGAVNTNVVPAGTVFSLFGQLSADTQALILCRLQAQAKSICLSSIVPPRICFGEHIDLTITAASQFAVGMEIASGNLPTGMDWDNDPDNNSLTISGTPTVGGSFDFTVMATDSNGNTTQKGYTLEVFGITSGTVMAQGQVGVAYLQQLVLDGTPVGLFDFIIVDGALPDGLALDPTSGIVSGTPTLDAIFNFTVKVEDDQLICQRTFQITTIPAPPVVCIDCAGTANTPAGLSWVTATQEVPESGASSASLSASGAGGAFSFITSGDIAQAYGQMSSSYCNDTETGVTLTITMNISWATTAMGNLVGIFNPSFLFYFVYNDVPSSGGQAVIIGITCPPCSVTPFEIDFEAYSNGSGDASLTGTFVVTVS